MTVGGARSYDLARFALSDMIECGTALRKIGGGAASMEEVAARMVRYLYDHLRDAETGERSCALVRFFKTHAYGGLDPELRRFVGAMLGDEPETGAMKCLTLLATAGDQPEWNSRHDSAGHKAIPLPSAEVILQAPMIAQLITQFGLPISTLFESHPELLADLGQKSYNVFHVPEALDSPHIPAQKEFVIPHRVRAALGYGGMLPSGDLFAIIVFSKAPIPREAADFFKTIALNVKLAILPFTDDHVFACV